jgi:hypothetical protein
MQIVCVCVFARARTHVCMCVYCWNIVFISPSVEPFNPSVYCILQYFLGIPLIFTVNFLRWHSCQSICNKDIFTAVSHKTLPCYKYIICCTRGAAGIRPEVEIYVVSLEASIQANHLNILSTSRLSPSFFVAILCHTLSLKLGLPSGGMNPLQKVAFGCHLGGGSINWCPCTGKLRQYKILLQ